MSASVPQNSGSGPPSSVERVNNSIRVIGRFQIAELHWLLAATFKAINQFGYSDIVFDFSRCTSVYPSSMAALCAQVLRYRREHIDFELVLPQDERLQRLFRNTNWAHLIAQSRIPPLCGCTGLQLALQRLMLT